VAELAGDVEPATEQKQHYDYEKERWLVDAAAVYRSAISTLLKRSSSSTSTRAPSRRSATISPATRRGAAAPAPR
jgi:CII-binding regulator of phage lambda lysogenization HflD